MTPEDVKAIGEDDQIEENVASLSGTPVRPPVERRKK